MNTTAARTAANGHPCPSWCVTEHTQDPHTDRIHTNVTTRIEVRTAREPFLGVLRAYAGQLSDSPGTPEVVVAADPAGGRGTSMWLPPADALQVATLVEVLQHATKAQHRELAAAIRQAAAVITGDGNG